MDNPPYSRIFIGASVTTLLLRVYSRTDETPQVYSTPVTFISVVLVEVVAWAIWMIALYPNFFSPLRHLPEPKGNSMFMGQYFRLLREPHGLPEVDWVNTIPNDGLIRYRDMLNREYLLITSPQALGEVLTTKNYTFPKPRWILNSIGRVLGNGLFFAEGDEHKTQRKNFAPAFTYRRIKSLYPVFWEKAGESADAMVASVQRDLEAGKKPVLQIFDWASRSALDIIGVAGMGCDFNSIKDPENELKKTYLRVFSPSKNAKLRRLLLDFLPASLVFLLPLERNKITAVSVKKLRTTAWDIIQEKKRKLARKELEDVDIISVALESGGFTDEGLVDQVMNFLTAGHVTTATALTWTIYLLSKHPEIQDKVRKQVHSTLPPPGPNSTLKPEVIDNMTYLHAVIAEALRLLAVVPITMREACVDTTITGVPVPKGTRVVLAPWAINRSTQLWGDDAFDFNPERWLSRKEKWGEDGLWSDGEGIEFAGNGGAVSNYANLTFLHGPRSCIGEKFAKSEMACILATWLGRIEFSLSNEDEKDEAVAVVRGGAMTKVKNGLFTVGKVVEGWGSNQ